MDTGYPPGMRPSAIGCMRLSTAPARSDEAAIAVIQAALDAGVRLLDTADAYCHDERDLGHNERLIARALAAWSGDRGAVRVATKGGLTRPGGKWVPDGRAKHLVAACEASLLALGRERIDLYQLHAPDPRVPLGTSVRALARLQREGLVEHVGLCNVALGQLEQAQGEAEIASVQLSLSPRDDDALRGGVIEHCLAHGIEVLAYRPFGGTKAIAKLVHHRVIAMIAIQRASAAAEIVLAWLRSLAPSIVPLPGPTRIATASACGSQLVLTADELAQLDRAFPAADLLRRPRAQRRPPDRADGEVVVMMGIPGAGKSTRAESLVADGYLRLNRDRDGGTLTRLAARFDSELGTGHRRVVLDNTYSARSDRNRVIETAWRHDIPVRCVWLTTSIDDARINAVDRMLRTHGRLLAPEEIARIGRTEPNTFGPRAQHDHERQLEPPRDDEGFTTIERVAFVRTDVAPSGVALWLIDIDRVIDRPELRMGLRRLYEGGAELVAWAWRPGRSDADDEARALAQRLGVPIELRACTHPAGPPICWCRPPLPGLPLAAIHEHGSTIAETRMIGSDAAGERFAAAACITFVHVDVLPAC
jgi:aryl-alcohol dehydrogenase-like predicted oxidoreductase